MLRCDRWDEQRLALLHKLEITRRDNLTPETLMKWILKKKEYWRWFQEFCNTTLELKEEHEREMDAVRRAEENAARAQNAP